jgi:hypothetical protein
VLQSGVPVVDMAFSGLIAEDAGHRHHWLESIYPVHQGDQTIGLAVVVTDVTELSVAICSEMGVDQHDIDGIRMAGRIHDIGKLSTPLEILTKPGVLRPSALAMIESDHGTQFDPEVVDVCLDLVRHGGFRFSLQDDDQLDRD